MVLDQSIADMSSPLSKLSKTQVLVSSQEKSWPKTKCFVTGNVTMHQNCDILLFSIFQPLLRSSTKKLNQKYHQRQSKQISKVVRPFFIMNFEYCYNLLFKSIYWCIVFWCNSILGDNLSLGRQATLMQGTAVVLDESFSILVRSSLLQIPLPHVNCTTLHTWNMNIKVIGVASRKVGKGGNS